MLRSTWFSLVQFQNNHSLELRIVLQYVILQNFLAQVICSTIFNWLNNPLSFFNISVWKPTSGGTYDDLHHVRRPDEGLWTEMLIAEGTRIVESIEDCWRNWSCKKVLQYNVSVIGRSLCFPQTCSVLSILLPDPRKAGEWNNCGLTMVVYAMLEALT